MVILHEIHTRNQLPTLANMHTSTPYSFFHVKQATAHSLFKCKLFKSLSTTYLQVFFGLLLVLTHFSRNQYIFSTINLDFSQNMITSFQSILTYMHNMKIINKTQINETVHSCSAYSTENTAYFITENAQFLNKYIKNKLMYVQQ